MAYCDLITDNLIEVYSVSSYIREIENLRDRDEQASMDLYFRGQSAEFYSIERSIFRNNMLSIEHSLMNIPLRKLPNEFSLHNSKLDNMTKYQHYGMCTRLLDLTTNPLVALYFACQEHGKVSYDLNGGLISREPYGVVCYINNLYTTSPYDRDVNIIAELSYYDLSKNNKVMDVIKHLHDNNIISSADKDNWLGEDGFENFIKIIQTNYLIIPSYSNERLVRQSGVFLLPGMFSVFKADNYKESIVIKSQDSLNSLFNSRYFYIRGERKHDILNELDLYNINKSTLFPELEYQLCYIKESQAHKASSVSSFVHYEHDSPANKEYAVVDNDALNSYVLKKLPNILEKVSPDDDFEILQKIIMNCFGIDWYKRESSLSKLRISIADYFNSSGKDIETAKSLADNIYKKISKEIDVFCSNISENESTATFESEVPR